MSICLQLFQDKVRNVLLQLLHFFQNVSNYIPKYTQRLTDDKNVIIWSNQRVRTISRLLVIVSTIILLVVPIVLLYFFESTASRLSIIVIFMMMFLCALSLCTRARNVEIFAATAAYEDPVWLYRELKF